MVDQQTPQQDERTGSKWRTYLALAFAVLFAISLVAANHAAWLVTTVVNTDTFVDTLAPLPKDPDVALALGEGIADSMFDSVEVGQKIADALPDGLAFLAVPVAQGLSNRVAGIATNIVQSDAFSTVWRAALTVAHRAATLFIRGVDTEVVSTEDGVVTLDLSEVAAPIYEQLDTLGFDVLDGTTPDLTIELFTVQSQGTVQSIVQLINSIRWVVLVLAIVLAVAVFVTAIDKRRATLWFGVATAAAMLFSLIDIRYLQSAVTSGITSPVQLRGVEAALDIAFSRFVLQSWIGLGLGLIIALGGWLASDSERAVSIRGTFTSVGDADSTGPNHFAVFVAKYKRPLEWGAVAVIGLLLVIAPSTSLWLVVLALIAVAIFQTFVEFIASKAQPAKSRSASESVD